MNQEISSQAEFEALDKEYRAYIGTLQAAWLAQNRMHSKDVYEVMRPEMRAQVHQRIAQWGTYITPFAEAWWKARGYAVTWPVDDSKPMQVYKLEAS